MNKKRKFLAGAVALLILLPMFFSCENEVGNETPGDIQPSLLPLSSSLSSPAGGITLNYSAEDPMVSELPGLPWYMGSYWLRTETNPITGEVYTYNWRFKNDGTIPSVHCCGAEFDASYSYFFRGNILVTYGKDMSGEALEATTLVINKADDSVSLKRDNGITLVRNGRYNGTDPSPPPIVIQPNNLAEICQDADGTIYEFKSDTSLRVTYSSGIVEEYGYLVRGRKIAILGPLVDGAPVFAQEYQYRRVWNTVTLTHSNGKQYSLFDIE